MTVISCETRHHVFDVALSSSKPLTVGGGLPAIRSTRYVRKNLSSFIAGKPPLIKEPATH